MRNAKPLKHALGVATSLRGSGRIILKQAWQQGLDTGKDEPVYVAGWLEEAFCGCVGSAPEKSHNKLIGRLLIVHAFSLSLSTGQHTEEGHCSAHSGEERAVGGAESEERWYWKSNVIFLTSTTPIYRSCVLFSRHKSPQTQYLPTALCCFFFGKNIEHTLASLGPHATLVRSSGPQALPAAKS